MLCLRRGWRTRERTVDLPIALQFVRLHLPVRVYTITYCHILCRYPDTVRHKLPRGMDAIMKYRICVNAPNDFVYVRIRLEHSVLYEFIERIFQTNWSTRILLENSLISLWRPTGSVA
jgi:hypothetical protein